MNLLKIAFRNCWRNKRRTFITAASITVALLCALLLRSLQLGTYEKMIDESVGKMSGYLQIEHPDYFYDPSIDHVMPYSSDLLKNILKVEGIKEVVPRIQTGALVSTGKKSKPALIYAIDVEKEATMSNPKHFLIRYMLNEQVIEKLKNEENLSPDFLKRLTHFKNTTYHQFNHLSSDLKLTSREDSVLSSKIESLCRQEGRYLIPNDKGVLIANKLADYLHVSIGDTIILMGQGYHGATAAGLFPIRGLIHSPSLSLNNRLLYMTIPAAQEWLNLNNSVNYLAVNLHDKEDLTMVEQALKAQLPKGLTVKNWKEYNKNLHNAIREDDKSGQAMIYILYVIVLFGIYGTMLMMVNERKREFSILNAIGMKHQQLQRSLLYEMILIATMGILVALIIGLPLIEYYHLYPIKLTGDYAKLYQEFGLEPNLYSAGSGSYIFRQIIIILLLIVLACYFPLHKINKINRTENK